MLRLMPLLLLPIVAFACSSGPDDETQPAPDSGADGQAACEPRPHHDSGAESAARSSDGGLIIGGGSTTIDLDSGTPAPFGRMMCAHPEAGVGFDCAQFGMDCCAKKDVCYDPATEPSFCDLPYCP